MYVCDVCNESFGECGLKTCMPTYKGSVHISVMFVINHSLRSEGMSVRTDKASSVILLCVQYRI
jgi:hypothetical protein